MCGRNTLTENTKSIIKDFSIDSWDSKQIIPQYNICPSSYTPVLISKNNTRIVRDMKWGLIPSWSSNSSIGNQMINARSESILEKPSFQNLVNKNRCIIFSSGYFEWKTLNNKKHPFYITKSTNKILPLAGLWTTWKSKKSELIHSYTIITGKAQNSLENIHHRMPIILKRNNIEKWINSEKYNFPAVQKFLKPHSSDLIFHNVSTLVNSTKNNSKNCILKINNLCTINLF
jgi:putative SOS response-associated peptidase YedK